MAHDTHTAFGNLAMFGLFVLYTRTDGIDEEESRAVGKDGMLEQSTAVYEGCEQTGLYSSTPWTEAESVLTDWHEENETTHPHLTRLFFLFFT